MFCGSDDFIVLWLVDVMSFALYVGPGLKKNRNGVELLVGIGPVAQVETPAALLAL